MSRPTRRAARIAKFLAIPVALLISGAVVAQASYSAYSATTVNPTNNWATGTVVLADDDSNTALFTTSTLKPGSTGTKCIAVTSTGTLSSTVKLYGTTPATTKALSSYITLAVTQGTSGTYSDCSGFTPLTTGSALFSGTLAAFGTTYTNFANGAGTWAPTGASSDTRTYKVVYTVDSNAPESTQGGTASIGLTWEAQNS